MSELTEQLKDQIIEQLNLEDISKEDIGTEDPLFEEGLGLDSIDALELIVLIEKEYGIKIQDPEKGKKILHSVKTMADFIEQNRTADA